MKSFNYFRIIVLVSLIFLLFMLSSCQFISSQESSFFSSSNSLSDCSNIDSVDASVTIETSSKNAIGINTDTDGLKFGKISPGGQVKRSIFVKYNTSSEVSVLFQNVDSDSLAFSSWITIGPKNFNIFSNTSQQVFFTLDVPLNAKSGNYTSKIIFCFSE